MKQPKLRFPEFTGDWKQHKFEDVVTIGSGKDYKHLESGNVPVYGTGGYMLSVNQALSESEDAVGIGRKGTIDKPYILRAPFWTVDTLFYCIPNEGFDLTFTNCLFQNVDWKKKDESTGVPSLSKVIINNVKTYVPSLEEQQKIASLFTELDNLIQSAEKELEGYRELKQGMLQKMFPKKGETVPEIRFPEFSGDWELCKLGDIGSVSMCRRIFKGQTTESGDIPFYKIGTFGGKADAYISKDLFEEYKTKYPFPKIGDILISASGSIGRTVEFNGESAYFQDSNIVWLNHDERVDNSFLKQFYSIVKWSGLEGSAIKRLYNDNILKTEISLPSLDEQKKIGNYFSNLDNLIASQQQELDGYKELKKGLLQQMFC